MKIVSLLLLLLTVRVNAQHNLHEYATGQSTIDESVQVQAAINANAGQTLIVPDDTFYVRNLLGTDGINIKGTGNACFMYYTGTGTSNGHLIQFKEKSNWTVDGIIIDGASAGFGTIFQVIICHDFSIKNSTLQNSVGDGNFGEAIALGNSYNGLITNNRINETDVTVLGVGGNYNIEVSYNIAYNGSSDGITPWGNFTTGQVDSAWNIHDNEIHNKTNGSAYLLGYSKNMIINNNYTESCSVGVGVDEKNDFACSGITITNNTFHKCRQGIYAPINNSVISVNYFDSTTEAAIVVGSNFGHADYSYNNIIRKNIILVAEAGIICLLLTNSIIDSNYIFNCTKLSFSNIFISSGLAFTNNHIDRANTAIRVSRITNSKFAGNINRNSSYEAGNTNPDVMISNDRIMNNKFINQYLGAGIRGVTHAYLKTMKYPAPVKT